MHNKRIIIRYKSDILAQIFVCVIYFQTTFIYASGLNLHNVWLDPIRLKIAQKINDLKYILYNSLSYSFNVLISNDIISLPYIGFQAKFWDYQMPHAFCIRKEISPGNFGLLHKNT